MDTKANLMTYNTFTFKTEAQMLLFRRIWEDNGTALFDKLKKKGCTRFCLNQIISYVCSCIVGGNYGDKNVFSSYVSLFALKFNAL